jgi:hypothetical protein
VVNLVAKHQFDPTLVVVNIVNIPTSVAHDDARATLIAGLFLFLRCFSSGDTVSEFEGKIGVLLLGGNDGVVEFVLAMLIDISVILASLLLCKSRSDLPGLSIESVNCKLINRKQLIKPAVRLSKREENYPAL